jgi:hypothetical protein
MLPLSAVHISVRQVRDEVARRAAPVVCIGVFALAALAGCGGKPAYCTDRTNLENSVNGLTNLNASSGISGLQSQVNKIQSDATAVVNSAKSDFPSQTSAIKSSVTSLQNAVKALPSNPSAAQIATVTSAASGVVNSVKNFTDASNSKCS